MSRLRDSLRAQVERLAESFADMVVGAIERRSASAAQASAPAPAASAPPPEVPGSVVDKVQALEREKRSIERALGIAMDPLVAKLVLEAKAGPQKKRATMMFADLVAFTTAAENMPPEALIDELDVLFSAMEPVLKRFRGHLDKYMGDALMAEFGVPYASLNHALMAALAAVRMQERMADWQFPWKMRIGLASGPILVGLMGSGSRKNFTAIGDKVNLAARLQQIAPPGGIWIDEEVHQAVQRWFRTRRVRVGLTPEEAKGLEAKLALLKEAMTQSPTAKMCAEAADVCSQLGDMEQALRFHRQAHELDPDNLPFEKAMAATLLTGEDRSSIRIKGKQQRVAAYELLGLRDFVAEGRPLPSRVVELSRRLVKEVGVPEEWLLCIEASEGILGHGQSVAALAAGLADFIGLEEGQVRHAFLAGYLHDVGKRTVPEHLLNYDGALSDLPASDQDLVRSHVTAAPQVLKEIKVPVSPEVLQGILQHHENFDGSGYPRGLKGADIALVGRIIRVVETYETLTCWRPYRDAWTSEAALGEIGRDINRRRIDPELGEAFLRMMGINETETSVRTPPVRP
ncbi:MAG: HD domain-containing protein [Elusimicrobia bacterium]|nr:HD domain-containing protein [Elusimicrobiota bacterium]